MDHNKNRIDRTGQIVWSQMSIKILAVHSGNSVLDNSNWDKINYTLTKKSIFAADRNSPCEKKKRIVNQIL